MLKDEYPALWLFLGGYLHQDWDLDYDSPEAALRDFIAGEHVLAPQLPAEVDRVLARGESDAALNELLLEFGSSYLPTGVGASPRTWLTSVRQDVRAAVDARR